MLAPVLVLAWGATWLAFPAEATAPAPPSWRAPAVAAAGLTLFTVLLLPPAGGFPGGWLALTLTLGPGRAPVEPAYWWAAWQWAWPRSTPG